MTSIIKQWTKRVGWPLSVIAWRRHDARMSISPTFYNQLFHAKVYAKLFSTYSLVLIFLTKEYCCKSCSYNVGEIDKGSYKNTLTLLPWLISSSLRASRRNRPKPRRRRGCMWWPKQRWRWGLQRSESCSWCWWRCWSRRGRGWPTKSSDPELFPVESENLPKKSYLLIYLLIFRHLIT